MRSERMMLDLILGFAKEDTRIRAVVMSGSRGDPTAPRDRFQDYDIVYVVSELESFVADRSWIQRFGDILIMQTPDENSLADDDPRDSFAFLMLFTDGNRIDLTFHPLDKLNKLHFDSLSVPLLDKDGILPPLPPPGNRDYLPMPPTANQFSDCCNEFWWVSTYIAKGLWRRELPYAKTMFEGPVRDMLMMMLTWHIGIKTGFKESPGKAGKYFVKFLEPRHWEAFVRTYADGDYEHIWQALFTMCDLFREIAIGVAEHFGFVYALDEDKQVTSYLKAVHRM
ncbi:aminoglycoside 6-adenylyltransferase [Cohnella pontilimi]|uniref:Aminoglycoside 6-adenylyltransferase n=1 Tax=Cohnella pontilimi TaxID=2564100 RepID=A0A4U0F953_9BACL|nr:aminoglycoside 6-adenylyltransferase [Cohnella pontilimi]TJY41100.1 aminoglycoside 6-adenylyltransferase [Cohnella pontilimi]